MSSDILPHPLSSPSLSPPSPAQAGPLRMTSHAHHAHSHPHTHHQDHSPAFPHSTEGDCSGCTYGVDGQLLIGGLAIDGSLAGEDGWATTDGQRRLRSAHAHAHKTSSPMEFQTCTPSQGPSTFAVQQERDATPPARRGTATLSDIIEGRTCRPIALLDLRTFLALRKERQEEEDEATRARSGSTSSSSTRSMLLPSMTMMQLADLSATKTGALNITNTDTQAASSCSSSNHRGEKAAETETVTVTQSPSTRPPPPQCQAAAELNALNFVVAFDRYSRAYRAQKETSPGLAELQERYLLRGRPTTMQQVFDAGLQPSAQPLRARFEAMAVAYLGELPLGDSQVRTHTRTHRMDWLIDLGLLSEDAISEALHMASATTNPEVLLPLVTTVLTYLDTHVMPAFLASASRNLSKDTARGRLAVGIVCTSLAILFSVLLCIEPSPLTGTKITRWYRILTLPLWTAGIGYVIAAFTKVCVWLSLRGNREPGSGGGGQDEAYRTPRTSVSQPSAGTGVGGDVEKTARYEGDHVYEDGEEGNLAQVDGSNWLMAPEVWVLLTRVMPFLRNKKWNGRSAVVGEGAPAAPPTVAVTAAPALQPLPTSTSTGSTTPLAEPQLQRGAPSTPKVMIKSISVPGTSVEFGLRTVVQPARTAESPARRKPRRHNRARSIWTALQRWTGFAVGTERIRDESIRRIHQKAALQALVLDGVLSIVVTIVVVAIP